MKRILDESLDICFKTDMHDYLFDSVHEQEHTYPIDQHNNNVLAEQIRKVKKHYTKLTGKKYKLRKFTKWKMTAILDICGFFDANNINKDNIDIWINNGLMETLKEAFPQHSKRTIYISVEFIKEKVFWTKEYDLKESEEFDYPWPERASKG